jgi:predicted nuclease of restriction endonuclease-like (RecB) superfamily
LTRCSVPIPPDLDRGASDHEEGDSFTLGKRFDPAEWIRRYPGRHRRAARCCKVGGCSERQFIDDGKLLGGRSPHRQGRTERQAASGIERLSLDLTEQFGRGFSRQNLQQMRAFFQAWPIRQTVSGKSPRLLAQEHVSGARALDAPPSPPDTGAVEPSRSWRLEELAPLFALPWSAYVRLFAVKDSSARRFYEAEALRGGWSVRQLDRQISSQFYERTALSRNKAAMLKKASVPMCGDAVFSDDAVKDPYVLEFLNLKDEYSESDLEEALIHRLEDFLLELGGDFSFVGRQRRLHRPDLVPSRSTPLEQLLPAWCLALARRRLRSVEFALHGLD